MAGRRKKVVDVVLNLSPSRRIGVTRGDKSVRISRPGTSEIYAALGWGFWSKLALPIEHDFIMKVVHPQGVVIEVPRVNNWLCNVVSDGL